MAIWIVEYVNTHRVGFCLDIKIIQLLHLVAAAYSSARLVILHARMVASGDGIANGKSDQLGLASCALLSEFNCWLFLEISGLAELDG